MSMFTSDAVYRVQRKRRESYEEKYRKIMKRKDKRKVAKIEGKRNIKEK